MDEIEQAEMQSPALGLDNLIWGYRLGREWLENCPVEKDLRMLVDNQ